MGRGRAAARVIRICIATPTVPSYSETFIRDHIDNLPFESILIHGLPRPSRDAHGRRIPGLLPMRHPTALPRFLQRGIFAVQRFSHRHAVARHLRRHRIDVVLAEFGTTGAAMVDACAAANVPLVVHFHGFDAYRDAVLAEHLDSYPRMFAAASAIVVVSTDMERQLLALGAPREKLRRIVYGVDPERFRGANPARAAPTIVAVGRFVEKKAPQLTLSAFAQVARLEPAARLVMVGDGPLLERCREQAATLGLADRVEFPGVLAPAAVAQLLATARVFAQHSIRAADGDREGTPVAILEAQAAGLPVVATRHAGIPDVVVDQVTGALVDEGDVDAMARDLLRLVRDPELAGRCGAAARSRAALLFTAEASRAALASILREAAR
ncbi:MAG: glycosyltransferase [Candidatus Binatia bacterium]